jgi:putative spermidine/putrescine transport system ATP-binding protein
MARLRLDAICKRYGDVAAVQGVTLDVADGEFVVLLGPSGCGKTTTLRVVAGLAEPTSGTIRLGERDITHLPAWRRNAGLVFQSYALFPHLTVADNVAFGLQMHAVPAAESERRIGEMLRLVRLEHLRERLPRQLSGGQQQRVALARAIAFRPDVLLLDEPLSSLDAQLRQEVRIEIRDLQKRLGLTTVMVTHDQEEALTMADRLVIMREGAVHQVGTQQDLYERPADPFVAGFVGRSSFLRGTVGAPGSFCSAGGLALACPASAPGPAMLALRPERLRLAPAPQPGMDNDVAGVVEFVSYLGATVDVRVRLSSRERVLVQVPSGGLSTPLREGESVRVAWSAVSSIVFATGSEQTIDAPEPSGAREAG